MYHMFPSLHESLRLINIKSLIMSLLIFNNYNSFLVYKSNLLNEGKTK